MMLSELLLSQNNLQNDYNILLNPHGLDFNKDLWSSIYLDNIQRKNSKNLLLKFYFINFFLYKMRSYLKRNHSVFSIKKTNVVYSFYYVDLYHVLSNHIYSQRTFKNYYVIEDGLLNYYNDKSTHIQNLNLKQAYFRLFSFSYNAISSNVHLTGISLPSTICQYVTQPEHSINPSKSEKISLRPLSLAFELNSDIYIILGQEPLIDRRVIDENSYLEYLVKAVDKINKLNCNCIIYYKPHPMASQTYISIIGARLNSVKVINDKSPVELLVAKFNIGNVLSLNSTALLTLKNIYKEKINVFSCYFEDIIYVHSNSTLTKLFLANDILLLK